MVFEIISSPQKKLLPTFLLPSPQKGWLIRWQMGAVSSLFGSACSRVMSLPLLSVLQCKALGPRQDHSSGGCAPRPRKPTPFRRESGHHCPTSLFATCWKHSQWGGEQAGSIIHPDSPGILTEFIWQMQFMVLYVQFLTNQTVSKILKAKDTPYVLCFSSISLPIRHSEIL